MKHSQISVGITLFFVILFYVPVLSAADDRGVIVSGPDGTVGVDLTTINSLKSESGVSVPTDTGRVTGIPVWKILQLVDKKKTLGPGDIIEITGDNSMEIQFLAAYMNDDYLLADTANGLSLYISSDGTVTSKGRVTSIGISSTDDWTLTLITGDVTKKITKSDWESLVSQNKKEKTDSQNRIFSGIPIYKLFETQGLTPARGSLLKITGQDRYSIELPWDNILGNEDFLLADRMNQEIIPKFITLSAEFGNVPAWPLMVIDPDFPGNNSVGSVAELKILN